MIARNANKWLAVQVVGFRVKRSAPAVIYLIFSPLCTGNFAVERGGIRKDTEKPKKKTSEVVLLVFSTLSFFFFFESRKSAILKLFSAYLKRLLISKNVALRTQFYTLFVVFLFTFSYL